jgi:hypothetical protein
MPALTLLPLACFGPKLGIEHTRSMSMGGKHATAREGSAYSCFHVPHVVSAVLYHVVVRAHNQEHHAMMAMVQEPRLWQLCLDSH